MLQAIVIVILVYAGVAAILYVFQSRLLYFPARKVIATPDEVGLSYTPVSFVAADDTPLTGWFVPAEHASGVVLFLHGNGGNISYLLDTIEQYHLLGLDTFVFDYRGYGESGGRPSEKGTYLDAEAAWQYLTREKGVDPSRIILIGRSLGGAVAAWLAQTVKPRALVIESSFTSVPDIAADAYRLFPARLLTRFKYRTREYLQKATCPVLIVHSPQDELIPFHHAQELFAEAPEPKEFLQIARSHNEAYFLSHQKYLDGLKKFLATYPPKLHA